MTTVGHPDTLNYATVELASCLVTSPARAYGSEGWDQVGDHTLCALMNDLRVCARLDGRKPTGHLG
jgi:hypothetical protein